MSAKSKGKWLRIRNGRYVHRDGRFRIDKARFGDRWFVFGEDDKVNFVLSGTTLREAKANVEQYLRNEAEDAKYAELKENAR